MKLTLIIKILPTAAQRALLLATLQEANKVCNYISKISFNKKLFNQFNLHKETYHPIKNSSNLSSQMIIRCIGKVAESYQVNKKTIHIFKPLGSIAYDSRILTYKEKEISIWCIGGRQSMPYICHNKSYVPYIKGESDLVFNKGKWYLFQTVDIPDEAIRDVEEFIGVDFGQTDIAVLSDGTNYNSERLKKVRKKYSKVRSSVQSKGTKGAKKLLKRLSGRERRFVSITNHAISKQIVSKAKSENKGVAIENLTGVRKNAKTRSKRIKTELNRWAFCQLRRHLEYKSKMAGIPLIAVPPAYTSKTCNTCFHIGDRNGKRFSCKNCGNIADADHNAAKNISTWGCLINQPEKSTMFCSLHSY